MKKDTKTSSLVYKALATQFFTQSNISCFQVRESIQAINTNMFVTTLYNLIHDISSNISNFIKRLSY
ncbi:hypothetical protein EUGRSUZ_H03947 [Eucalyptus grandis]|uniref:Uncharacterized protein n=2 Tax=Eucalyptus grandis TaxID=71139 RepID=A0ACC3JV76_EUCGR|nr:hypothetical protein EUGRSUZ_H03947 [Eucalyptus grandis]